MMRKILIPLIASMLLLGGCLTSQYNLRTIDDADRYYQGFASDSTTTLMKWDTPDWHNSNAKYWRSGGVIITNPYNALYQNDWLADIVADGFEGIVYVQDDQIDLMANQYTFSPWNNGPQRFPQLAYQYKIAHLADGNATGGLYEYPAMVGIYTETNNLVPFPHTSAPIWHLNPNAWTDQTFADGYVDIYVSEFAQAKIDIGDTEDKVKFGVCLADYQYDSWNGSANVADLTKIDPATLGKDYTQYTPTEIRTWIDGAQDARVSAFVRQDIEVIVRGDRLTTELSSNVALQNGWIIGYFFEDVNASTIAQVESDISAMRAVKITQSTQDALLLIAGVRDDVYHSPNPNEYAQFINRLILAGMYFTPGADNDTWNVPITKPGEWWIRSDNDLKWQDNAPTYASVAVGPRQIMLGVQEVEIVYDSPSGSVGLGAGGWLEGGAIHPTDPSYVLMGVDVNSAYYSTNYGNSWEYVSSGLENREDIHNFYGMDIVGIDNDDFSGFLMATSGGIYSFPIDGTKTFTNMTPWDDPEGTYISEVKMGGNQDSPWGYWIEGIPFASIYASPDNKYIVASTGRYRFGLNGNVLGSIHYPKSYVNVNYSNPVGRQGLWYYWYDDPNGARWRPLDQTYDSWIEEHGVYNSIAMGIAGADTVVVMASSDNGPQMYNISTGKYTDLSTYPWHDHAGNVVSVSEWGPLISSTNNIQSTESIELSDRMTAYVCLTNDDGLSAIRSGVYRMHNVLYPTAWEWIGDQTDMPYSSFSDDVTKWTIDERSSGQGLDGRMVWNYVTMNEGSGAEPDTLWIGERGYIAGASSIIVPYGHGEGYDQQQTWTPGTWLYNHFASGVQRMPQASFPTNGWNKYDQSVAITFEPMVNPQNANEVIVQSGSLLLKSLDRGASWQMLEPRKTSANLNLSSTTGYEEMCANDLAIFSDGRLVVSFGDNGLAVAESGENWTELDNLNPRITFISGQDNSDCDSDGAGLTALYTGQSLPLPDGFNSDLIVNNDETSDIHVEPNWNGTGRDALFFASCKAIGLNSMGNIIMYHDSDGDGTWETTSVTTETVSATRWKYGYYFGQAWVREPDGNDMALYIPYKVATTSACVGDWIDWGVHKFAYNSTTETWTRSELNNFNDFDWGDATYLTSGYSVQGINIAVTPYDIVHSVSENKLYLATSITGGTYGRVWELDLDDTTPMWVEILGYNSYSTTPTDERDDVRDPRNLEISDDGTTLYISNIGYQSGRTGIWKVTDLNNDTLNDVNNAQPNWTSPTVEFMINNPSKTTAWALFPPERYGEVLTDRGRRSAYANAQLDAEITGMLINPDDNDQIWYTVENRSRNHPDNGIWAYDTTRNVLVKVAGGEDGQWIADLADENLMMDTIHTPWRIVVGTDCTGVYWMNYDRIFHTDKETSTTPLLTPDTSHEYPPNGVFAIAGNGEVDVYWNITPNDYQNGVTGYYIYRGTTSGSLTKLSTLQSPSWSGSIHLSYNDATAVNGTEYFYALTTNYTVGGETALGPETKATPRENRITAGHSTEDFFGDNGSTAWTNSNAVPEIETYNPFGGTYDATTAQGWESNGTSTTFSQIVTSGQTIPSSGANWVLVSCYVHGATNSLTNGHDSQFRFYDGITVYNYEWTWTTNEEVLTVLSVDGTDNDGQGHYYVGDGWHRVWFKLDLSTRGLTTSLWDIRFMLYKAANASGNGMYTWGVMVEFGSTEPTELCEYIPVAPITGSLMHNPPYWGDENCVTLEPATPSTPAGFTLTPGDEEITLDWNADISADEYVITRGPSTGTEVRFTTSPTNSLTDPTVYNYVPWYYQVATTNADDVTGTAATEIHGYANEWTQSGGECVESTDVILNAPDFGSTAASADSGSVDFAFVYDDATEIFHIIQIAGQVLNWTLYNNTTVPNATHLEHYTSSDLTSDGWTRQANIPLYDSVYATTNAWAPHIIKYGSTWYMFYTAVDASVSAALNVQRIMVSTSTDLYNWSAGSLVLEGDDYKAGVTPFTLWDNGATSWNSACRDAHVIRAPDGKGWLMYTSVTGDGVVIGDGGMIISIAETRDKDYSGPAASLVGNYLQYDYLIQTSNSTQGYAESAQVMEYDDGYYYLHWTLNSALQGDMWIRTTTPEDGTLALNTWDGPYDSTDGDKAYNKKAPEWLLLTTGEVVGAYLESQPWNSEYYHIKLERFMIYSDGTFKTSNIMLPECYFGSGGFQTSW